MVLNAKSKFPSFQPFPFTSFEKKFCRILMPLFKKFVSNIKIQNYKRKIAKFLLYDMMHANMYSMQTMMIHGP